LGTISTVVAVMAVAGQVDEAVEKIEAAVGRTTRKTGEAITRVGNAVKR
jgi:hypothetical protein